jgi:hypothetical protein
MEHLSAGTEHPHQAQPQAKNEHIDGSTLPYSGPNLATMLSGVTNPIYVLKRIDNNGNPYPFTLQARD